MKNYTNFVSNETREIEGYTIIYMRCDQGVDWYDAVETFSEGTYKLQYDKQGIINSVTKDASMLTPLDYSVLEVDSLPDDIDILLSGRVWIIKKGKITARVFTKEEIQAEAQDKKRQLLEEAAEIIAPLQDAVDLDIAEANEVALLTEWKKYRVMINRVDAAKPVWPGKPDHVA